MGDTEQVGGSSLPTSVSGCIPSFLLFICMWDQPHFTAQHNVKETQKTPLVFFSLFLFDLVMMRVLNQFLPLTLSQLTPTQEGKQTSQESVSTTTSESQRSNQHR